MTKVFWSFFKKRGKFKDIILPRKKDTNNNIIGFIVAMDDKEASSLIKTFNGKMLKNKKLYLSMAKSKRKVGFSSNSKVGVRLEPTSNSKIRDLNVIGKPLGPGMDSGAGKSSPVSTESLSSGSNRKVDSNKLEPNTSFIEELDCSIWLHTVNSEIQDSMNFLLEGLGYKEEIMKGISDTSFNAHFPYESDLKNIDMDFILIAFSKVERVN